MNKLRLIKIYELRKHVHPIEAFIIELLEDIRCPNSNEIINEYWKDDTFYFSYYPPSNNIIISYQYYAKLDKFGCSYEETDEIMKYLLEKHLKLKINEVL